MNCADGFIFFILFFKRQQGLQAQHTCDKHILVVADVGSAGQVASLGPGAHSRRIIELTCWWSVPNVGQTNATGSQMPGEPLLGHCACVWTHKIRLDVHFTEVSSLLFYLYFWPMHYFWPTLLKLYSQWRTVYHYLFGKYGAYFVVCCSSSHGDITCTLLHVFFFALVLKKINRSIQIVCSVPQHIFLACHSH